MKFSLLFSIFSIFFLFSCNSSNLRKRGKIYLGIFKLRYYWIVEEADYPGARVASLYFKGRFLAFVSKKFYRQLILQGTGRLKRGVLVQYRRRCRYVPYCLEVSVINRGVRWGLGASGRKLIPFYSVAADRSFRFGVKFFIPELKAVLTKNGWPSNGCFEVHDRGGKIRGRVLDIFVGNKRLFRRYFRGKFPSRVKVYRVFSCNF